MTNLQEAGTTLWALFSVSITVTFAVALPVRTETFSKTMSLMVLISSKAISIALMPSSLAAWPATPWAIASITNRPRSATAISILVGSPTNAPIMALPFNWFLKPVSFNTSSTPFLPEISSSALATKHRLKGSFSFL